MTIANVIDTSFHALSREEAILLPHMGTTTVQVETVGGRVDRNHLWHGFDSLFNGGSSAIARSV